MTSSFRRQPQRALAFVLAPLVLVPAVLAADAPLLSRPVAQATPAAPAPAAAPTAPTAVLRASAASPSAMDAMLFYQLLIGELEMSTGRPGVAVDVMLDAARRSRDEALFQRAVEMSLEARAGDKAASAARTWRTTLPDSLMALRYQVQILAALGRTGDAAEPVRSLLARSTAAERAGVMATLPRLFVRGTEARAGAEMIEQAVQPYTAAGGAQRDTALVSAGRAWLLAGDDAKALALAEQAAQAAPVAAAPVLLALEMLPRSKPAEALVLRRLGDAQAEPALRLAYVRVLTQQQRLGEAADQLRRVTVQQPQMPGPWLTLGAIELDLKHPREAEAALQRYLELTARPLERAPAAPAAPGAQAAASPGDAEGEDRAEGRIQARLLLAQVAELRGDFAGAERQLAQIDDPQRVVEVQTRRAMMLAKQGQWRQARELIQRLPAGTPEQARTRTLSEVQVLREAKRWREAHDVLDAAVRTQPRDTDLIYEQAMMAEKLERLDDMERLLRRVIEIKPDHQHAYNALGYSLADRGLRLDEARQLIEKALALAPGDPFITDSLGWLEYRAGRNAEALRLLRTAYQARPDTEIAAHLGEVLWKMGQHDEARRIWREGRERDRDNEVLRETLTRLKPSL